MGGRHERYGHLLAGEVGDLLDAGAVAGDQRFRGADQADDEDGLDRQPAAGGRGQRARADIADIDRAGSDRGNHVGAGIELAPVDRGLGRLLISAVGLRHFRGFDHRLVADGDLEILGRGRPEQRSARDGHGRQKQNAS